MKKLLIIFICSVGLADVKISQLTEVSPPQVTVEAIFPMVNDGTTYKMPISTILQTPMIVETVPSPPSGTATLTESPTTGNPWRWLKIKIGSEVLIFPTWKAP